MSYATNTILARDEPKEDKFDRLRVVGPSPIKHSSLGEWAGEGGDSIIVQPEDEFGGPEILPIRIAAEDYHVESEPEPEPTHVTSAQAPRAERQLSPEEQFRRDAKSGSKKTGRGRTAIEAN